MVPNNDRAPHRKGEFASPKQGKVSTWGNSQGVRIPKVILDQVGISVGDCIDILVTDEGYIQISKAHRRVPADRSITMESLLDGMKSSDIPPAEDPWPSDVMIGAEKESWSL